METKSLFEYQFEIIKTEISQLQETIGKIDELTQQLKYWTIFIWAGSLSILLTSQNIQFRHYLFFNNYISSIILVC